MKTVLLTGAFGNLGCYVLDLLLQRDYQITCFDLPTKANLKAARPYLKKPGVEIIWGDICDAALMTSLVARKDAIIHLAAMLPPAPDDYPELSRRVNVDATAHLLTAIQHLSGNPVFIYTSSCSVFGDQQHQESLRTIDEPVQGSDHYSSHKAACESLIQSHTKPWVILRMGVAIDARLQHADKRLIRAMLEVNADNRLEYVHPADVALAVVHAAERKAAWNKVHLIGGGPSCRIRQRDLVNTVFGAVGLSFNDSDLGGKTYYTDWMDTASSQADLDYQYHSFADFHQAMFRQMRVLRIFVKPISRWVKKAFLSWIFRR